MKPYFKDSGATRYKKIDLNSFTLITGTFWKTVLQLYVENTQVDWLKIVFLLGN